METNINKAINKYYMYKKKYEDDRNNKKKKIINNINLSIKEKKDKIKQIKLPCIFCSKNSGTLFYKKKGTLYATCGDNENPCEKYIEINVSIHANIINVLDLLKEETKEYIEEIINCKTKLLLNIDEHDNILHNFEEYVTLYDDTNEIYSRLKAKLNSISTLSNKEELNKLLDEFNQHILSIKTIIKKYNTTLPRDQKLIDETNKIYIDLILPLEEKISALKYKNRNINNIDNFNYYNTSEYNLKDLDILYDVDDPEIIKFDI